MSLDERHELEELDALAAELTRAARTARAPMGRRDVPDQAFAARLRAQLLGEPPALLTVAPVSAPSNGRGAATRPLPKRASPRSAAPAEPIAAAAPARPPTAATPARLPSAAERRPRPMPDLRPIQPAPAPEASQRSAVQPIVRWKMPSLAIPRRWVAAGLAACIAVGALFYGATLMFPGAPFAVANVAEATTLVHAGTQQPLKVGDGLHEGDEIMVGIGGAATVKMGDSFVRLAPGADVRLRQLRPERIVLEQLAGEAYSRVAAGGSYAVVTGPVTWTAQGTAFDIARHATASGGEEVLGLALLHDLELSGGNFDETLSQGESALVELSAGTVFGAPAINLIALDILTGPWLAENARLDGLAGLDLGELAVDATLTPVPSGVQPSPQKSVRPTATASRPIASTKPSVSRTRRPAVPTIKPTPKPTPTGPVNLGGLTAVDNVDGTYTFSWPRYAGTGFAYYKLEASPWGTSPSFPTASEWASNSSVDQTTWTGFPAAGDWAVRVQVLDESNGVVIRAQTSIVRVSIALPPTVDLGALTVVDNGNGTYTFSWTGYGSRLFDYYKLVFEPWPNMPSYLSGSPYWDALSPGTTSDTLTVGSSNGGEVFLPGEYAVRIQAIGYPLGTAYVFAQTSVAHVTILAAPTPTPT